MSWDSTPPTDKELTTAKQAWDDVGPDGASTIQPSAADAAVKGFGNGVTLGWLPNIEGGAQSAADLLRGDTSVLQNYRKHRDENYKDIEDTKNAHPAAYLGGNIAGGVATSLVPGLGEASIGKLALMGGAAGLGGSRADLTTGDPSALSQGAGDAVKGATIGLAAGAAGQAIGGALGKFGANRAAAAETGAADAVGASPGAQATGNVGKTILDNNVLQKGNLMGTYQNAQGAIEKLSNDRDLYLSSLGGKLGQMNPNDIVQKVGTAGDKAMDLLQGLTDDASGMSSDTANGVISDVAAPVQDYVQKLNEAGNDIQKLQDIKGAIQGEVNTLSKGGAYNQFNPNASLMNKANALKQLGGVVKQHIEDLADVAEPQGGSILANKNQQIGNLSEAIGGIKGQINNGASDSSLAGTAINIGKAIASPSAYTGATAAKSVAKNFSLSPQTNQNLSGYAQNASEVAKQYGTSVGRTGSLYSASDDELKDLATRLQNENGTASVGKALSQAVESNDPSAKNRAIFLIKQTSGARKIADDMNQH